MVGMLIKINFTFKKFNFNSATTIYLSYSYPESPKMVGGVFTPRSAQYKLEIIKVQDPIKLSQNE